MTWRPAGQDSDQTTGFAGPESGEVQPVAGVPGVTGLSITRVDERTLDSAAWRDSSVVSSARRVVSADGGLLAVRQSLVRGDGSVVQSFQVYRRARD